MLREINPAYKIIILLLFFILVMISNSWVTYVYDSFLLIVVIIITKLKFLDIISNLKYVLYFALTMTLYNGFYMGSGDVFIQFKYFVIHTNTIMFGIALMLRMSLIVSSVYILMQSLSNYEFTKGLEYLLRPFKLIGLNPIKFATIVTISIRMVPLFNIEISRIEKAQAARGHDFRYANIFKKFFNFFPILIPLIINSLSKADQLAVAMDVKKFDIAKTRSSFYIIKIARYDNLIMTLAVIILITGVYING